MSFAWPWALLGLLAVPLLVVVHRRLLARRATRRADLAGLGLVAPPAPGRRRRHVAPVLYLLAGTVCVLALARPQAAVAEPHREGTVVLAFDVSSSMAATDLAPTRIEAAKAAARELVAQQPAEVRLGVVAFGTSGLVTQQPTTDRAEVLAAIDRVGVQGGTALGRGIQTALTAVAGRPVPIDDPDAAPPPGGTGPEPQGPDLGFYPSAAVVLFSDGENTSSPDPLVVAEAASTAGVRIYSIGLGTARGAVLDIDGFQVATALDEQTLRQISEVTDGRYVAATDARALAGVYGAIDLQWTVRTEQREVTGLFAAAAALLLLLGAGLSLAWFGRVI